ncbi:peptide/nickel transport system substrate-binding protein [Albimonas donghaensis]|uniref:Peptide/nickel transport system substrate-binding protein n=1 Tax=Albimonas donghaensis TaxID=356660 RepID=A0A1H2S2L4_9RHOB|nr:peptide ABC transporter substrate-binding protein [Albimonas donghaensis]SDW25750.1 peptide/nickel transport system substrate-binding protein [Albimonas donghaensis]
MRLRNLLSATAAAAALGALAGPALAERGADGQVNIIYWQAVSILNPYLSGGTKDVEGASLVLEPLARYDETGTMVPWLVEEIPTVENGGVSEDLMSITWKLKPGLKWSDGSDVTAADAVFTADYCMDETGGCQQVANYADVASVEAVDDLTIKITFTVPKPVPYGPFVGAQSPILQAAQFADCKGAKAPECTDANFGPIGTGPYVVAEFKPNDVVVYEANPHYREADKPAFGSVLLKGGGDAVSAARSVMETGEFDYAWNMQVEPEILAQMEARGIGKVISAYGTSVERFEVNMTNPDPDLGDLRSTVEGGPHPFLTDPKVTRALSMAIDREILVEAGYGAAGQVTCNVLPAPDLFNSTANDWCKTPDVDGANALLDEAGWVVGSDGVREKDGVKLSLLYQTSTNSVRQGTQALIKQMWQEIGVETELRNISGSVFFGGDPSSPDTFQKLYADVEMFTNNFDGTDPEKYMANWRCSEIPSPKNNWLGGNNPRFCSEEYDALVQTLAGTAKIEERAEIAKQLNDMLMESGAIIPLIHRGRVAAMANTIEGHAMNPWDSELWDIASWSRAK